MLIELLRLKLDLVHSSKIGGQPPSYSWLLEVPATNKNLYLIYTMKEIVSKWVKKQVIYLENVPVITLINTPNTDWYDLEKYVISMSWHEDSYQFDWEKFYVDHVNKEKVIEQLEEHQKILEKMVEEWKTEEERNEFMKGKWTEFIDRFEVIFVWCDILETVKDLVNYL